MTPKERLQRVSAELRARGIKVGGFTWDYSKLNALTPDEVFTDVAVMLEAYLDGKCTPFDISELDN